MKFKSTMLMALACLSLLTSCSKYAQIVYTTPTGTDIKKEHDYYVFENDTIRLVYTFWGERGVMSFMVYNKSTVPLYIDWKKSSFINRDRRVPYYSGKTTRDYTAVARSSGFGFAYAFQSYLNSTASSKTRISGKEVVVKEERVTFIPPKSYIFKQFDNLVSNIYYDIQSRETKERTIDGVHVYESLPGEQIEFRNFITYSTSEEFNKESFVDNGFAIKKILTINKKDFLGDENDDPYSSSWYTPTRFYLKYIDKKTLEGNPEHYWK